MVTKVLNEIGTMNMIFTLGNRKTAWNRITGESFVDQENRRSATIPKTKL